MKLNPDEKTALGSYRVLDLTDEKGWLCGHVLALLGAEVIKIEPPCGDSGRNIPPFYKDIPHPERSLYFFSYNTNKRGITLDINTLDGKHIFESLVKTADFVIESFDPGFMNRLGLGYTDLVKINPRIIVTSISPFGQTGPYRDYKASDLLCSGMSGFMYLTGDPDRAPLRISAPQSYALGATDAAVATLIANYHREKTGEGQYVDVSIRDAMIKTTINALPWWEHYHKIMTRGGHYWMIRGEQGKMRVLWPCKDGWISFGLQGGPLGAKTNRQLVEWMDSEGKIPAYLKKIDWEKLDMENEGQKVRDQMEEALVNFFKTHTRAELNQGVLSRGIMSAPVYSIEDIANNPHLEAREFWEEVAHPDLGTEITFPGAFCKASETPCIHRTRAPLLGEYNWEIYANELGIPEEKLQILKAANVI